ncbi:MAG: hypothetical protein Q4D14_03615 [Bacteroidales bacterium]|nr:hypothetical protein [Bacteroidales bacterium]
MVEGNNTTQQHHHHHHHHAVSMGQWAGIFFILLLPFIGLGYCIIESLSKKEGSRRNFARTMLCFRITIDIILALLYFNGFTIQLVS